MYTDIKQEVSGLEEPHVSDSEGIRDSSDEVMRSKKRYETVGSRFLARPVVQQKDGGQQGTKPCGGLGHQGRPKRRGAALTLQPGQSPGRPARSKDQPLWRKNKERRGKMESGEFRS